MKQVASYLARVQGVLGKLDKDKISQAVDWIIEVQKNGGTLYTCGNGGSASTASHVSGDLLYGTSRNSRVPFKAVCLSDNITSLTSISNDQDYEDCFVEPLQKFLLKKDIVLAFSGSGNSQNVVKALEYANYVGAKTIAFCGFDGGKINTLAKLSLHVPIDDMEVSEDVHLILFHCIKQAIIARLDTAR